MKALLATITLYSSHFILESFSWTHRRHRNNIIYADFPFGNELNSSIIESIMSKCPNVQKASSSHNEHLKMLYRPTAWQKWQTVWTKNYWSSSFLQIWHVKIWPKNGIKTFEGHAGGYRVRTTSMPGVDIEVIFTTGPGILRFTLKIKLKEKVTPKT